MIKEILEASFYTEIGSNDQISLCEEAHKGLKINFYDIPQGSLVLRLDRAHDNYKHRPFCIHPLTERINCCADYSLVVKESDDEFSVIILELKSGDTTGYYDQLFATFLLIKNLGTQEISGEQGVFMRIIFQV